MNRPSFLKSLGAGIAVAVIAPKIIIDGLTKKEEVITAKCLSFTEEHVFTKEGHFEEDIHLVETKVYLWDMTVSRDNNVYVVTYLDANKIGLTAVDMDTVPNELMVDKNYFGEYFIIISNAFHERRGS